jgi:hypothetical protein
MSRALATAATVGGLLLLAVTPDVVISPAIVGYCRGVMVTGYVRTEFSAHTYDGTSIYTDEPIAAASWDIPIGQHVVIKGLGRYRVADRGMLGSDGWVDVAVWSRSEAYAITGRREACIVDPGDPDPFEEAGLRSGYA